ncbi:MAG: beta-galactosidase, partial [Bacteroidetes bacterium]|nr:beta-galactosidase [Bacteroidota bacterium]
MAVSAKKISMLLFIFFFMPLYGKEPQQVQIKNPRERLLMDFNWRFAYGHRTDIQKDFSHGTSYFSYLAKAGYGDGPASKDFDDRSWRLLDLPHDWAVELPFDSTASFSHGYKSVGRNFPQWSIGWYRKSFVVPKEDFGKRIVIEFDGVYRNATVWFNGFFLGEEKSGYNGFSYDITDYIDYGGKNVVAVRVDATMEEGWFYEGAGIYRHVWLKKIQPLHIDDKSVFIRPSISGDITKVVTNILISNESGSTKDFILELAITDSSGKIIARRSTNQNVLEASSRSLFDDSLFIPSPHLWSVESPYLYKINAILKSNLETVDSIAIPFGIRSIYFDAQKGFFLNGKHVLLKGTNNHQDHAGVGVALSDGLQEYRIRRLKEMGCNAYRCSHNPPTPELLDVCDRLGMLVVDENRLMGTTPEHLELLKRMILRDRNHPSVILWSIGNEEWAIEGNETGARIATTMQRFVHSLDSTRPVTYANSGGWGKGISTVQEVMGYNYIFNGDIDKHHQEFP